MQKLVVDVVIGLAALGCTIKSLPLLYVPCVFMLPLILALEFVILFSEKYFESWKMFQQESNSRYSLVLNSLH